MTHRTVRTLLLSLLALAALVPVQAQGAQTVPSGGVVLDAWGGLHPFGGATLVQTGAPSWKGWDIARSLAVLPDGSGGWELDGWGGVHAFGAAPQPPAFPYWKGWDIARALVMNPDQTSGYELDGWGGVHEFGGAPALSGWPYWKGWDIARGLSIHYDSTGVPDGGWTLDAWGGVHGFGNAPSLPSNHYYRGFNFWQGLHVTGNGAGAYLVGRWGIVDSEANPAGITWSGHPTWGGWDIARDMVPMNPVGSWTPAPVDRAGAGVLVAALNNLDRANRGLRQLSFDSRLVGVAGDGDGYNLRGCGGSGSIADRSQDMFNRNYFGHTIPGCSSSDYVWQTYYAAYGVSWSAAAENIGWDSLADVADSAWAINNAWLNSPDHLANITSSHYSAIGCGGFSGTGYQGQSTQVWIWTCDFRG